jgi:ParB family transcriptional regulator, chromosome partitioning protein
MTDTAAAKSLRTLNRVSEDISKNDLFYVAPHLLEIEEGFNVRGAFDETYFERADVKAHIRAIADSYLAGRYVPPMTVRVKSGRVLILDGMHRKLALDLAISEGAQIQKLAVTEFSGDETQETLLLVNSAAGRALNPIELAVAYGRLKAWNWSVNEIAKGAGKTAEHVRQTLKMLEMPVKLKQMISNDEIAATYALELYNEHGDNVVDVVTQKQQQLSGEVSSPKGEPSEKTETAKPVKITKSKVNASPRLSKPVVKLMHSNMIALTAKLGLVKPSDKGVYTVEFTEAEMAQLMEIKQKLDGQVTESTEQQLDLLASA